MRKSILFAISLVTLLGLGILWAQQPFSVPTTTTTPYYVQYARVNGGFWNKSAVISGLGATRTLTANESGAVIDLDRAAGIVVTLPAPAEGLYFDFVASVSVTSNAYKVSTATQGTDFIAGGVLNIDSDTSDALVSHRCDGTTHDNYSMNGTTTGGLIGTKFRLTAVSGTVWVLEGRMIGNGTVATSCSTT